MSCDNCESYECLRLGIAVCNEWVSVPLVADTDGVWRIEIQRGQAYIDIQTTATSGERLILPTNIFNENATHILKIFRQDGSQFSSAGKCYKVETYIVSNVEEPDAPTPPSGDCVCVTPDQVLRWNDKSIPVYSDAPESWPVPAENDSNIAIYNDGETQSVYTFNEAEGEWQSTSGTLYSAGEAIEISMAGEIGVAHSKVVEWDEKLGEDFATSVAVEISAAQGTASAALTAAGNAATAASNAQTTANNAIPLTQKGAANGVGTLDGSGKQTVGEAFFKLRRKEIIGNYTVTAADAGVLLVYTGIANIIVTFPAGLGDTNMTTDAGFACAIQRRGAGVITLQAGTSAALEHPLNYMYIPAKRIITVVGVGGNTYNLSNTAP